MTRQSQQNKYRTDGYLLVQAIYPEETVELLAEADRLMAVAAGLTRSSGDFNLEARHGGYLGQDGSKESYQGLLRKISNVVKHSELIQQISRKASIIALVDDLLGGVKSRLIHSILWYKPAQLGSPKPPHQDAPYLTGCADDYVTLWIALDQCTAENGCLEVVPGSHKAGLVAHVGDEPQVPEEDWSRAQVQAVPMTPGQALAFHPYLLHASGPNNSDRPRRAITLRYQIASASTDVT
jgi:phytanoyl-CoA hydroxylase